MRSAASAITCALFRPDWPVAAIVAVLALSGFFTSFQFTGYNAIAYAEVEGDRMSAATTLYATFQQLMLSLGICATAMVLQVGTLAGGRRQPTLAAFSAAFVVVSAISGIAFFWNRRFAADAGETMSGHRT
ncbi:hypothetical protein ACFQ15_05155 [Sphingomonas hankookensis]|uniref:hypothetical protein n=1 Tax=Sphingomonas hankookensis TaxID=563996 RepID=UPI001F57AF54|nr:hypothetical protein [Sphingomonas hankookensis]